VLYHATSNNSSSALHGKTGKHENCIFSLKCYISALLESNQSLLHVFNLFDSQLILTPLYDSISLNLEINAFSSGLLGGHGSGERKSIALQQLDCVARTLHQCPVFWVF